MEQVTTMRLTKEILLAIGFKEHNISNFSRNDFCFYEKSGKIEWTGSQSRDIETVGDLVRAIEKAAEKKGERKAKDALYNWINDISQLK